MTNIPSFNLPPQTPRSRSYNDINPNFSHNNRLSTPSLSFGFNFSPSFNFNNSTPSTFSPRKFLQMPSLGNMSECKTPKQTSAEKKNGEPLLVQPLHDISQSTPDNSQHYRERHSVTANDTTDGEKEEELWSSIHTELVNISNLTSIHEDDKENKNNPRFITSIEGKDENAINERPHTQQHHQTPILHKLDRSAEISARIDAISNKSSMANIDATSERKRTFSSTVEDTPNNTAASKIAKLMDSPLAFRKHSVANSIASSVANDDKVWNAELDEILMKCLYKYRQFKDETYINQSLVLKRTSQNRVLSRMIMNKTGILRTAKQISSRIFRLTRSGKLQKDSRSPLNIHSNGEIADDHDIMFTPLEEVSENQHASTDSILRDALIDKELDILLSSSPLDMCIPQSSLARLDFSIRDFKLTHKFNDQTIVFTKFTCDTDSSPIPSVASSELHPLVNRLVRKTCLDKNIPVFKVSHNINLNHHCHLAASTPMSAISPTNVIHPTNLSQGHMESVLSIAVQLTEAEPYLTWYSSVEVFKGNQRLFCHQDIIIGLYNQETKKHIFQIPLLKNFFAGHISYLMNGAAITHEENIYIAQTISSKKETNNLPDQNSNRVHLIHDFDVTGNKGLTTVEQIQNQHHYSRDELTNEYQHQRNFVVDSSRDKDDNETILADSSPYKSSSPPRSASALLEAHTPSKKLRIDVQKANDRVGGFLMGPMTAPVYNSDEIVKSTQTNLQDLQKFNPSFNVLNNKVARPNPNPTQKPENSFSQSQQTRLDQTDGLGLNLGHGQIQNRMNMGMDVNTVQSTSTNGAFHPFPQPGSNQIYNQQVYQITGSKQSHLQNTITAQLQLQLQMQMQMQMQHQPNPIFLQQVGRTALAPFIMASDRFVRTAPAPAREFPNAHNASFTGQISNQQHPMQFCANNQFDVPPGLRNISNAYLSNSQSTQHFDKSNKNSNSTSSSSSNNTTANKIAKNPNINNGAGNNTTRNTHRNSLSSQSNLQFKPMELTFCPIIEYDPSKNSKSIQQKINNPAKGVHCFPINQPVIYKPKK